jgi:hypothetical protein
MAKLPEGNKLIGEDGNRNKVSFYCEILNDNIESGLKPSEWINSMVSEGTLTEKECELVMSFWMRLYAEEEYE